MLNFFDMQFNGSQSTYNIFKKDSLTQIQVPILLLISPNQNKMDI